MHNKRDLKLYINNICRDLAAECLAASITAEKQTLEELDAIISSIIIINNDFIKRVSHPEPGMEQKAYYRNLIEDFRKSITEVIDQISGLEQ